MWSNLTQKISSGLTLCEFYIGRIQTSSAFLQFKGYLVAFANLVNQTGSVYEVFII